MDVESASLTVKQAYQVMLVFLKREYELTESEDLADLLAEYALGSDGEARDDDIWDSWLRAAAEVIGAAGNVSRKA